MVDVKLVTISSHQKVVKLLTNTFFSVPAPGHFIPGYHYGYHGYHPKCTTELEAVTKTLCRVEVEKECETKTKTFTKITGYEDTDCKEIELKKPGKLINILIGICDI